MFSAEGRRNEQAPRGVLTAILTNLTARGKHEEILFYCKYLS